MSFRKKVVIVTGASSGIGAATAIKFAEQGANVVLAARNQAKLKEVADKCEGYCGAHCMVIADVTKNEDIKKIVATTVERFGKIDVLVNNAGVGGAAAIWDTNAMEVYDKIMATNLRSVVYLTNLAAPHLIKTKGNIVNISSIAAVDVILPEQFAYCTSKAGLDHFTRSVALDFAAKGVRVNSVNPGPVQTNFVDNMGVNKADVDDLWKKLESKTPLGRISVPEEIADLVLFLASDKAMAITGSSFITDNGILLKRGE
ncbi:3-oxoacyl-[acyl-carrier-protein] reductase FabG-like [Helicoverpa zea]|uniref:3-oxoacyl-[acyl-carrier-protein] reductase FabG-like n=1 Tax=Helicoverpa zea TaxID=7113 RepID=UPI001F571CDF|nr:3-oxoacyl-[acyl-carrier-protein] reductase FabG-like [Helicoverpa zea]